MEGAEPFVIADPLCADADWLVSLLWRFSGFKLHKDLRLPCPLLLNKTSDSLPGEDILEGEDEEAETEVDKVLGEILKKKVQTPAAQVPAEPVTPVEAQPAEEEEVGSEEMLAQMRGRLEALKS